jgi:heat shock protein HtpX
MPPAFAAQLAPIVKILADRAGLAESPRLYMVPREDLNAFAVGQGSRSRLGLTQGLLRNLDSSQLGGVLAHEVAHLGNRDTFSLAAVDAFQRLALVLSHIGLVLLSLQLLGWWLAGQSIPWE